MPLTPSLSPLPAGRQGGEREGEGDSDFGYCNLGYCLVFGSWNLDITVLSASCNGRENAQDIAIL
jgi:hypothetical protein